MKRVLKLGIMLSCVSMLSACSPEPKESSASNEQTTKTSSSEETYESKELNGDDVTASFLNNTKNEVQRKLGAPKKIWTGEISDKYFDEVIDGYKSLYAINTVTNPETAEKYKKVYTVGEELRKDSNSYELLQYNLFIDSRPETPESSFLIWVDSKNDKVVYQGDRALIDPEGNYAN